LRYYCVYYTVISLYNMCCAIRRKRFLLNMNTLVLVVVDSRNIGAGYVIDSAMSSHLHLKSNVMQPNIKRTGNVPQVAG